MFGPVCVEGKVYISHTPSPIGRKIKHGAKYIKKNVCVWFIGINLLLDWGWGVRLRLISIPILGPGTLKHMQNDVLAPSVYTQITAPTISARLATPETHLNRCARAFCLHVNRRPRSKPANQLFVMPSVPVLRHREDGLQKFADQLREAKKLVTRRCF